MELQQSFNYTEKRDDINSELVELILTPVELVVSSY